MYSGITIVYCFLLRNINSTRMDTILINFGTSVQIKIIQISVVYSYWPSIFFAASYIKGKS